MHALFNLSNVDNLIFLNFIYKYVRTVPNNQGTQWACAHLLDLALGYVITFKIIFQKPARDEKF